MKTDKELLEEIVKKFENQSQMTISNKIEMEFCLKESIKLTKEEMKERFIDLVNSILRERVKELEEKNKRNIPKFQNFQNTHWLHERIHQLKEVKKELENKII
jgi:regulatory protein YycI of two-component signal transduction system YycFG